MKSTNWKGFQILENGVLGFLKKKKNQFLMFVSSLMK